MKKIAFILLMTSIVFADNFFTTNREGWFWYKDETIQESNISKQQLEKMGAKELEQTLDKLKDIAVSDPSEENLKNYILVQNVAVKRSEKFATVWQKVLLEHSELDIAAPLSKSGFENNARVARKSAEMREFWQREVENIAFVVFYDPKEEAANSSMQRVYYLLSSDIASMTGKEPVIRFVDLSANQRFKDDLGIVTTPDNFILHKDETGAPIYKRIKAGISTKAELLSGVLFVNGLYSNLLQEGEDSRKQSK